MILALFAVASAFAVGPDRYKNFAELAEHEREGVDYRVRVLNAGKAAPLSVMAIHGGDIEIATSDLAAAIAEDRFPLYLFEGIKPGDNRVLHITSSHFDEPRAFEFAARSKLCVSIHGFLEKRRLAVCVGGANARLRDKLAAALKAAALGPDRIEIESPCERFSGSDARNIVNRCGEPGVQLETSTALRRRMDADAALRTAFAKLVRDTLVE